MDTKIPGLTPGSQFSCKSGGSHITKNAYTFPSVDSYTLALPHTNDHTNISYSDNFKSSSLNPIVLTYAYIH